MNNKYYDETYIEDTFREVINIEIPMKDAATKEVIPITFTLDEILTNEKKLFLEEYAPLLFTIVPDIYDLEKVMLEWATLVHNYSHSKNNFGVSIQRQIKARFPKLRENKKPSEKIELFKNNLKSIYDATGGNAVATKKGKELKKMLEDACRNPNDYFPTKPTIEKPSKEPIEEYLISLQLEGKSPIITQFIKELIKL